MVVFFDKVFKSAIFWPDKNWISKYFLFLCFRTLNVEFFGLWHKNLEDGCQKCNLCLQKSFLKRWYVFEKKKYFWFRSLIEGFSDFWQKKCMVLKTGFHMSTGYFSGKKIFNENLNTWFWDLERKTFQSFVKFFLAFCQNAINDSRGTFGGLDEVFEKFWHFWQKFLAWVSNLLSTCPRELFEEKNTSTNFYSIGFFRASIFSVFWWSFL